MEWYLYKKDDFSQNNFNRCIELMTSERKAKILAKNPHSQYMSVFGEWVAKSHIADTLNIPIEKITILHSSLGKPYADGIDIKFSISHSGNYLAVAFDKNEIGIDIEQIRHIDIKITKKVCTESDLLHIKENNELQSFFEIWTAKEAYFKKMGTGITSLKSICYKDIDVIHHYKDGCVISIV